MSIEGNKGERLAEQLGGKIKQVIARLFGNVQLKSDGKIREVTGKARMEAAKAGERGKARVEQAVGAVSNRAAALTRGKKTQAEGKVEQLKGQARRRVSE